MALRALAVVLAIVALAAAGLAIYGTQVKPARHTYEQVLPDDRFPK